MVELLRSGEEHGIFNTIISFADGADSVAFEQAEDIFVWLEEKQKISERADILRVVVFPAILSDMLHFIYEALESSRKAKLNVTYALLRKPLQENLFILESIARDSVGFAEQLATDPLRLRATKMGGSVVHSQLIGGLLQKLGVEDQFDAQYLAQLRYEKCDDGFDGICNTAMHLFTEHPKIRTENLDINFIFSSWDHKFSQWAYLYSRLPYILAYTREVVEHVCESIAPTCPQYLEDLSLRVAASSALWWKSIPERYKSHKLEQYAKVQQLMLEQYYVKRGLRLPPASQLECIALKGPRRSLWSRLRSGKTRQREC